MLVVIIKKKHVTETEEHLEYEHQMSTKDDAPDIYGTDDTYSRRNVSESYSIICIARKMDMPSVYLIGT